MSRAAEVMIAGWADQGLKFWPEKTDYGLGLGELLMLTDVSNFRPDSQH